MAVDSTNSWKRRRETLAVTFFLFCFLGTPFLALFLTFYLIVYTQFWWLMSLYLVWMFWDYGFYERGGRPWNRLRNASFWSNMADYFPLTLVKTAELDPKHNYILCWHPHGIISLSAVVNMLTNGAGFADKFPGINRYLATLDLHFKQPLRRDVVGAFGCIGASFKALAYVLGRPEGGNAVALVVGGAEEALEAHSNVYRLCFERRKGFIKLALRTGAYLVPVYSFGETSLYDQVDNPVGSRLRNFQTAFKRVIGLSPVVVKGVGFFENSFGILPYRRKITTVVGTPIPVQKIENPTIEDIDRLHKLYKQKLIEHFEAHKHLHDIPADSHLEFY